MIAPVSRTDAADSPHPSAPTSAVEAPLGRRRGEATRPKAASQAVPALFLDHLVAQSGASIAAPQDG